MDIPTNENILLQVINIIIHHVPSCILGIHIYHSNIIFQLELNLVGLTIKKLRVFIRQGSKRVSESTDGI